MNLGGRGTYSRGKQVQPTYQTVDTIEGVKVLQGMERLHNLPEESHSSSAYILHYSDGNFKQYRAYHDDHTTKFDIDYPIEPKISRDREPIYHIHFYNKEGVRDKIGRKLTKEEVEQYMKYFKRGKNE